MSGTVQPQSLPVMTTATTYESTLPRGLSQNSEYGLMDSRNAQPSNSLQCQYYESTNTQSGNMAFGSENNPRSDSNTATLCNMKKRRSEKLERIYNNTHLTYKMYVRRRDFVILAGVLKVADECETCLRDKRPHIPERKLSETNLKVRKPDNLTAGTGKYRLMNRQPILSTVSLLPSTRKFHLRTILHNVAVFESLRGLFSEPNAMFPDCVLVDSKYWHCSEFDGCAFRESINSYSEFPLGSVDS
ncbi:hypothetical protein J6590_075947 [Homalodisca vitripennis]|nr:hypothetical protein J6590_075947 [Homalodisca vitripennis]